MGLGVCDLQRGQDRVHALGPAVGGGDFVGNAGLGDLLLGADQALGQRGLRRQEGGGDFGGGQAADGAQRERRPRVRADGWVAADEDQSKPVVLEDLRLPLRRAVDRRVVDVGLERFEPRPPPQNT